MPRIPTTIAQQPLGRVASGASSQSRGPALAREQFPDRQQNAAQENARKANMPANACPFINGNMLTGISFVNGVTTVLSHGLGRPYRGFMLMRPRFPASAGVAVVLETANPDSRLDASQISIFPDGTFIGDVWVY